MTDVKEFQYTADSWVVYVKKVKEIMQRELTDNEYKIMMNNYVLGRPAENSVEEISKC